MSSRPLLGHWDGSSSSSSSSLTLPLSSSLSSSISRQKQKMKQRRLEKQRQLQLQQEEQHQQQRQRQQQHHHQRSVHRQKDRSSLASPTAATVSPPSPSSFHVPKSSSTSSSPTSVMFPIAEEEEAKEEAEGANDNSIRSKNDEIGIRGSCDVDVDVDVDVVIQDDDIDKFIFHDDEDDDDCSNKTSDSSNVMSGLAGWNNTGRTVFSSRDDVHRGGAGSSADDVSSPATTTVRRGFATTGKGKNENDDDDDDNMDEKHGQVLSEEFKAALDRMKNMEEKKNNNFNNSPINTPPGSDFTTSTGGVLFGNENPSYALSPASSSSLAVATAADGGMSDAEVERFFNSTTTPAAAATRTSGGNYSLWDKSTTYTATDSVSVAPSDENNVVDNIRLRAQKFSSSFHSRRSNAQNLPDSARKRQTNGNGIGSQTQQGRDDMARAALSRAAQILGRQQQQQQQNSQRTQTRTVDHRKSNNVSLEREDDEATRFVLQQMNKLQSHSHAANAKYRRVIRSLSDGLKESSSEVDALQAQLEKAMAVRAEKQSRFEYTKILREHEVETSEVQTLHLQIVLELMDIVDPTDTSREKLQQNQKRQADLMRAAGLTTSVVGGGRGESTSSSDVCSMDRYKDVSVDELRV
eukprot:CAMPEP_0113522880 /NCGR_PEP_ID=MMETSP0014_2-20120614/45421_1 /TAXON_ID=2857 /ORGANISM="Nitzschia sp." /LENGTH=635 /DNA_ID=CAMNT_0000420959 /DNA_START=146 /DNA_END=2049 /DNA_ORIENTATION=- /assembly_acc=CAM_ASM_000159